MIPPDSSPVIVSPPKSTSRLSGKGRKKVLFVRPAPFQPAALPRAAGTVALFDRGGRETGSVTSSGSSSVFAGFRFPPEVISVAVRWYLGYGLSYRDVEELRAERGVTVDHVTICRWVQRFTPEFIEAARPCRHAPGDRWFVDETYVKVSGQWAYLYRAVDQHGQVIDVLLSIRRYLAAVRRFSPAPCGSARSRPSHY
jgi:hypothetical protein